MATKAFEVKSYQIFLGRKMNMHSGAGDVAHFHGYIVCQGPKGERYTVYFVHPESKGVENFYDPRENWAASFVPAEYYPWYVDLLRNEKPVFAQLNQERPEWNRLFTGSEPVGEGELGIPAPRIQPATKKPKVLRR